MIPATFNPKAFPNLVLNLNNKDFSIHSSYNPIKEGERLFTTTEETLFICIGMGYGYHLWTLPTDFRPLFLFEDEGTSKQVQSDFTRLHMNLHAPIECSYQLFNEKTVPNGLKALYSYLSEHAEEHFQIKVVTLPGYARYNPQFCTQIQDLLSQFLNSIKQDLSTIKHFRKIWERNWKKNESALSRQAERPNWKGKQVVVVAAGPSLNLAIDKIRNARQEKAVVFSTDTAMPSLVAQGIVPDAVLTIDCQHYSLHHHQIIPQERRNQILLVLDAYASPSIREKYPQFTFVYPPDARFKGQTTYSTGGNVTHAAVSIAKLWGAQRVRVYGADFSYEMANGINLPYCKENFYDYSRRRLQNCLKPIETENYAMTVNEKNEEKLQGYKANFLSEFGAFIQSHSDAPQLPGEYQLDFGKNL